MIEIPIIYGQNIDGERWIEYVCSDREEAKQKIAYLRSRKIIIPGFDHKIWNELGLSFIEREFIIKRLEDFQSCEIRDKASFSIEYDYLNSDSEFDQFEKSNSLRVRVIKVSEKNQKGNYIHWLIPINEHAEVDSIEIVYKISLPKASPIGKEDIIDLSEFKIVKRPSGFTYKDKSGINRILHSEYWLFIKYPHE